MKLLSDGEIVTFDGWIFTQRNTEVDSKLNLPLDWTDLEGNEIAILHALVVLKGIDKNGTEVDTVMHTEGLSLSNALGLARFAVLFVEDSVRRQIADSKEE